MKTSRLSVISLHASYGAFWEPCRITGMARGAVIRWRRAIFQRKTAWRAGSAHICRTLPHCAATSHSVLFAAGYRVVEQNQRPSPETGVHSVHVPAWLAACHAQRCGAFGPRRLYLRLGWMSDMLLTPQMMGDPPETRVFNDAKSAGTRRQLPLLTHCMGWRSFRASATGAARHPDGDGARTSVVARARSGGRPPRTISGREALAFGIVRWTLTAPPFLADSVARHFTFASIC